MKKLDLRNLSRVGGGAALLAAALVVASLMPKATHAEALQGGAIAAMGEDAQHMTYEVYAGGINAVTAELDVNTGLDKKSRYTLALRAATKGFLGKIVPWTGSFETRGWQSEDGRDMPEIHRSASVWRGDEDMNEYHYGKDGSFKKLIKIEAGEDVTPKNLDDKLTQGTTDVLTATLEVMKAIAKGGKCEGTSEVFDGARRFELVFVHEDAELLEATEYNAYQGPAERCTVEVKPIAGKWHEKPRGWMSIQEQGRDKGTMPTVWMAQIGGKGPAVPVKVRVKTDYGTLFMHLIRYKEGTHEIIAQAEDD